MESVGSILDKICIAEKRISIMRNDMGKNAKAIEEIRLQIKVMLIDMASIITSISKGERPATVTKNKIYDPGVDDKTTGSLVEELQYLDEENLILWDLEDVRRDLVVSDRERLQACDEVAVHNKRRNNRIENIDAIIGKLLIPDGPL